MIGIGRLTTGSILAIDMNSGEHRWRIPVGAVAVHLCIGSVYAWSTFNRPIVVAGQLIPSSNGTAIAAATGTDFGNVGRNVLRGPRQINVDLSVIKRFPFGEAKNIEFRAEFFNLFNHVNFANPISNLNAFSSSGGSINQNTGQILNPGDFGRITSASNNPRLIQFVLKVNY